MIRIKSFLTGVSYNGFKLTYVYFNEELKPRERCSYLKSMLQARLHVRFFKFFQFVFPNSKNIITTLRIYNRKI